MSCESVPMGATQGCQAGETPARRADGTSATRGTGGTPVRRMAGTAMPLGTAMLRRMVGAAVGIPCLAIIAVGVWLAPDARGYGTHEQLGLPACGFLARTGWPCPSCGLTTSVSNVAHGHIVAAFWAQPFGVVLFAALLLFGVAGLAQLASGKDFVGKLGPAVWWIWVAAGAFLAGWGFELARRMWMF